MNEGLPAALKNWLKRHPRLRHIVGSLASRLPPSVRLGRDFWYWYTFFRDSEKWSVEQHQIYQLDCLRDLLRQLKLTSAFYAQRLADLDVDKIRSTDEYVAAVDAMSRVEFAKNLDRITSRNLGKQKVSEARTSGTTGFPLQFYHATADTAREWASVCHQWKRVGYLPGKSRRAEFRGLTSPGSLVDAFPERNMVRCSVTHLKPEHVRYYAETIDRYGIDFYHGYPSALHLLAATIVTGGLKFPQPKGILLASEQVLDWQVDTIERAFPEAKIMAHYGCAERTVMAAWCEHRREYHTMPQYSIVEVDPATSEIIGTNLYNTINGFVRYRMTDTVLTADMTSCPDCGRSYVPRIISLGGRSGDYLFSCAKGWIPPTVLVFPLHHLRVVSEVKFVQRDPEKIVMQYAIYGQEDKIAEETELSDIRCGLLDLFGDKTSFVFERVDGFQRSASGKFNWIVNEMEESRSVGH